jgi:hypothetical protein
MATNKAGKRGFISNTASSYPLPLLSGSFCGNYMDHL